MSTVNLLAYDISTMPNCRIPTGYTEILMC